MSDETPRTWTAPVSGRYHAVNGQEPHLVADCTDAWDLGTLELLPPADRIAYIAGRLAADTKNKTSNVMAAILALRNLAEEMRDGD